MKKSICILLGLIIWSCNQENAWNCIQTAGPTVVYSVETPPFSSITVNRDVQLFVTQGDEFDLRIQTGENLVSDIEVTVVNGKLTLSDNNSCNFVRDYGLTKVYVTAPDFTEIRNSSQYEVVSTGTISSDNLLLIAEDFNAPGSFNVGDFRMSLDCNRVQIVSNNMSSYFLDGQVNQLNIGFFSGDGRFEGATLIAQDIDVFHRGSNDMVVHPVQSLTGTLVSTGNLIAVNQPDEVDVEVLYTGELIFQD